MRNDGAFLVLFKDHQRKEVFLVFRSDFPVWVLTGGGIEEGETPQEAAIREAKEETGFEVKPVKKVGIYKLVSKNHILKNTYFYEGRVVSGTFKPEFVGCRGERFSVDNLPADLITATKQLIREICQPINEPFVKEINRVFQLSDFKIALRHPFATIKFLTIGRG